MTGINKITDRITADAQKEAEAIIAEAQEKCEQIKKDYAEKAQERYDNLMKIGTRDCEMQVQRLQSTAQMESKKSILSLKQEAINGILEKSAKAITSLSDGDYVDFLAKLAFNAASSYDEEIIFNESDKAKFAVAVQNKANELLAKDGKNSKLTISEKTSDFMGGIMLKQGDIEVNCTIETLLDLAKDELAPQIAKILFED